MKRKIAQSDELTSDEDPSRVKRRLVDTNDRFRSGLFEAKVLDDYTKSYTASTPYD